MSEATATTPEENGAADPEELKDDAGKPEENKDKGASDSKRRSGVQYPYYSLPVSLEFVRNIRELGNEILEDDARKHLDLSRSTKSWAYKLSSAKEFGLLQKAGRKDEARLILTDVAKRLLLPGDEAETQAAMMKAFLQPPLYQGLYKRFVGAPIPPVDCLKNVLERDFFLLSSVTEIAAEAFIKSAEYAGLVSNNRLRSVQESSSAGGASPSTAPAPAVVANAAPAELKAEPPPSTAKKSIIVQDGDVIYSFQLRKDKLIEVPLPGDLKPKDVERFYKWMQTLPIEDDE